MGLSEIAAGIEVTAEQRDRGVATLDGTADSLRERLTPHADDLPCTPAAAATVLEAYRAGTSVEECASRAGVAPMTAAKALHRCGVDGVTPLGPEARRIVRDWLAGEISRHEATALVAGGDAEFALAAYVEAHDPVPALVDAAAGAVDATETPVEKRDRLAGTMSDATDLR
ncbi:MAG: hypothetical protein ABEJ61_09700 [Haloferacaceae archaeon]